MIKIKHFLYTTILVVIALMVMYSFTEDKTSMALNRPTFKIERDYPASLRMYYCIEKYANIYGIPKQYAYGIANSETGYKSPFQWTYNANQVSPTGALGPMQILLSTARWVWGDKSISRDKMLNDIEFNVETSMKYLEMLYKEYKNWQVVFGYYNSGYPIINAYAINVYKYEI